ncbi:hypothetical protein U9M48_004807, partial [Paspalum notatum var. saurae]
MMRCKFFIWLVINNCGVGRLIVSPSKAFPIWLSALFSLGLSDIVPMAADGRLSSYLISYWARSSKQVPKEMRKGLNSLLIILLVAWDHACLKRLLLLVRDEGMLWCMAGADNLQQPRLSLSWSS